MPEASRQNEQGWAPLAGELVFDAEHVRLALDVGRTGIWFWDGSSQTLTGDRGLAALWGLPAGEAMTTGRFLSSLHPDDVDRVAGELRGAVAGGSDSVAIEFRVKRPGDAAERWMAFHGRRHRSGVAGGVSGLVGMARDVTARREKEMQVHLLMREVTHRSKNLLAIIQAMARQTVRDSMTAAEFEERFSSRLKGLAISHDLLAARDWNGAPVGDLVRWHLGSLLEKAGPRITIQGPSVFLKPEAAQNIGLAINELATNASRFGALSVPEGNVAVAWSIDAAEAERRQFHMSWRESGGPAVAPPRRYGFGHKVMERLAARALDGQVDLSFPPTGVEWSLHIPGSFVLESEAGMGTN